MTTIYKKLTRSYFDHDDRQRQGRLSRCATLQPTVPQRNERLAWLLLVTVLIIGNVFLLFFSAEPITVKCVTPDYSYETGFATDMAITAPHIELQAVQYTGGVERHPNGSFFLNHTGASAQYVGYPTPVIEQNWDFLESAISVVLTREEATLKDGTPIDTMGEPGEPGMYRVSMDVIHSLHCLNMLRKGVYADYYEPPPQRGDFYFLHIDHCIEHIRQALQCHADLTPLVYSWDEDKRSGNPIWMSTHTCRNFEKLLAWDITRLGKSLFEKKHD
ncbi:hypothetical protein LZ31DRAFT_591067 [Colletotrichum somersetense]|nr:hypothetical protein LZ31DRAFT_591067 [Colletotrichum somersetense]